MGDKSRIEWTDATWNPITGCTPVSPACDHCYAERMIKRFPDLHGRERHNSPTCLGRHPIPFEQVQFHPDRLDQPLRWKKPKRVFVCSMSDLFHEDVKDEWIARILNVMCSVTTDCRKRHEHEPECWDGDPHVFMVLTKRPERMKAVMENISALAEEYLHPEDTLNLTLECGAFPPQNWLLGVTAENQDMLDLRWSHLRDTPAAVKFISYEPGLGPLILPPDFLALGKRAWLIAGGETGPGARECRYQWVNSLQIQCVNTGIPFFFKGWGTKGLMKKSDPNYMKIDGREWREVPG